MAIENVWLRADEGSRYDEGRSLHRADQVRSAIGSVGVRLFYDERDLWLGWVGFGDGAGQLVQMMTEAAKESAESVIEVRRGALWCGPLAESIDYRTRQANQDAQQQAELAASFDDLFKDPPPAH